MWGRLSTCGRLLIGPGRVTNPPQVNNLPHKVAYLFLLFVCLAQADFAPDKWPLRRPIEPAPGAAVSAAVVDQTVYSGSKERLLDLRLVRNGREAPYVLEVLAPAQETKEFQPKVLNQAAVPGVGVEATLDLGSHPRHNQLRIASERHQLSAEDPYRHQR